MGFHVLGVGSYLPPRIVSNEEVGALADMPAERIKELFEVEERHWVRRPDSPEPMEGQRCSDLGAAAATAAMDDAGVSADDVDILITVSTTPDYQNPPLDFLINSKLGLGEILAYSLQAACTGVFRAAALVDGLFKAGQAEVALIVAAETASPFFRFGPGVPEDHRLNTVLYGDGAGALVVTDKQSSVPTVEAIKVATSTMSEEPGVIFRGMLSASPPSADNLSSGAYLGYHDFRRVLSKGTRLAWKAAELTLEEMGAQVSDVRFFLTHQATGNIKRIGPTVGIPAHKLPVNIDRVGNTISPSILILLDELKRAGELNAGDLLILHTAESSSWSYGGMAMRWA